jgi:YqjK-like protein
MDLLSQAQLLQRREALRQRSSLLRADWALQAQVLRKPLGLVDQARAGVQWLVQHPEWPIGAALLLVLLRPGRVLRWGTFAWQGYGMARRVQRLLAQQAPRR